MSKQTNRESKIETINKLSNKGLRERLLPNHNIFICGREVWRRRLNIDISEYYSLAHNATKESRLRVLHFKLLHNIYPTNITLNRMGIRNNDYCDTCKVKDYIEHMFIYCENLTGFWEHVRRYIHFSTGVNVELNDSNILLGILPSLLNISKTKANTINHILLVAKMSVSKQRYGSLNNPKLIFDLDIEHRKKYIENLYQ